MRALTAALTFMALTGCVVREATPRGTTPVNLLLSPPALLGGFSYELLGRVRGAACVTRAADLPAFWVGGTPVAMLSSDPLTRTAIAAATFDAVAREGAVDSVVLTQVVAQGTGTDRVCASIVGRGVRLLQPPPPPAVVAPVAPVEAPASALSPNVMDPWPPVDPNRQVKPPF